MCVTLSAMKRISIHRGIAAALLALIISACAAPPSPLMEDSEFPLPAAKEVFSVGYRTIKDRYIEKIMPGDFAIEGLRGLATIDPALSLTREDDEIVIKFSEEIVQRFDAPKIDDADGWAELTVNISAIARQNSAALKKADMETIYEAVFDGILSNLDIYSRYAGAAEAKKNRAKRSGFGGVGIRFRVAEGKALITFIMPETPAAESGLKKGDTIINIDGVDIKDLTQDDIGEMLRGPINSHVNIKVARKKVESELEFDVERAHIVPDTVTYGTDDGVVFLKISSFNQDTSRSVLSKLKKAHQELGTSMKGVILDMRGNPGGLLKQSIRVADLFLTQGQISETRGRHPDSLQNYTGGGLDMAYGKPVAVVLDNKSASAAEVTAAALQDRGRAVVVGTSSFGKGTVQTVVRLPNNGEVTLTWSRLIAPSGYTIHGLGIFPTVCTSGIDAKDSDEGRNEKKIAEKILLERVRTAAVLENWRLTPFQDKKKRLELRAYCPPERRKTAIDVNIAKILLNDAVLYARTLNMSASAAAAQ